MVETYSGAFHYHLAGSDQEPIPQERAEEEEEEPEEVTNLEDIRRLTLKIDPGLADERFFTERDEEIRALDMPEALQEHFGKRRRSTKEELGEEAAWIYRSAFLTNPLYDGINREAIIEKISVTLAFLHVETLDIPFIAIYRKEYVMDDLMLRSSFDDFGDWSGLWTVLDWDKRWAHLCDRRGRVIAMAEKLMESAEDSAKTHVLLSHARLSTTEAELGDIENHIRLLTQKTKVDDDDDREMENRRKRRPRRRERYSFLWRSGLNELADKFGVTASQLAENLQKYQAVHRPEDHAVDPQDMAIAWATERKDRKTDDPAKCLALARYMLITEIVAESDIVRHIRSAFKVSAMISTNPTTKARKDVDDNHPLRPFCTVQNKPASILFRESRGDFMLMQQAEDEGFATIDIFIKDSDYNYLLEDIQRFYLSQNLSATAVAWNEQRKLIVKEALLAIVEMLKVELRQELMADAREKQKAILTRSTEELLHQGPARFTNLAGAPRVLAITVTTREEDEEGDNGPELSGGVSHKRYVGSSGMVTFVGLDNDGEVVTSTELSGGWLRRKRDEPVPVEISKLLWKNIIHKFQPNCIVIGIGSGGKDTLRLKSDIVALLGDMISREDASYLGVRRGDVRDAEDPALLLETRVLLVNDSVATSYARSAHATASLAEMTFLQRRCVALGLLAQEPLTVYAAIVADKTLDVTLAASKFGHLLPVFHRREALRRSMVRSVCTVGVDLNRLMIHANLRPLLQYVGGLGVRKAEALCQAIAKSDDLVLSSRLDLLGKELLGRNVFFSASGFLKIRDPDLAKGGVSATDIRKRIKRERKRRNDISNYEPLDDTRMHPEIHTVAIKIAEQSVEDIPKKSDPSILIFEVMEDPGLLDALDLDQYAQDLEAKGRGKSRETMKLIVDEFHEPYKDWRKQLSDPSEREIFKCVTNMDPDTQLYVGALVTASDCRPNQSGRSVNCSLEGVVRGSIHKNDLSDQKLTDEDVIERVISGSSISCRVLELNVSTFEVKLACRSSVLNNPNSIFGYQDPEFYDIYCLRYDDLRDEKLIQEEAMQEEQRGKARAKMMLQQRKDRLTRRSTKHPFWKDVSSEEAERLIADAPIGDIIIRPGSTRNSISFTYKLYDGIVAHFKVNEEPEMKNGAVVNIMYVEANAGASGERYSDLDEVLARVIEPIIANYNEAVNYRKKFQDVGWTELQRLLREEKKRNPSTIPYLFCPDRRRERVGSFILGFLPGKNTVARATIIVNADGFKLRNVLHPKLSALFDWFKKNFRMLEGPPPPSEPSVAPMRPPPPPPPPPPPEDYPRPLTALPH